MWDGVCVGETVVDDKWMNINRLCNKGKPILHQCLERVSEQDNDTVPVQLYQDEVLCLPRPPCFWNLNKKIKEILFQEEGKDQLRQKMRLHWNESVWLNK